MHVARKCRDRRQRNGDSLIPENSEQSVQTDGVDMPPSYSFLFPHADGVISEEISQTNSTNSNVTVSLVAPTGDNHSRLSSGSLSSLADYQQCDHSRQPSSQTTTSAWRSRFPNMHLSVFDLYRSSTSPSSSWQHSCPSSPDLSYIQTPPPTYKEAIVIIGYKDGSQTDTLEEKTENSWNSNCCRKHAVIDFTKMHFIPERYVCWILTVLAFLIMHNRKGHTA